LQYPFQYLAGWIAPEKSKSIKPFSMYTGHFAAALAIKAKVPKARSWALFVGVGLLDFLFSLFIVLKWEVWTKQSVSIPWSHSLLMGLVWGLLYAFIFCKKDKAVFIALAVAVFSHFILDFFVHPRHLVLYPSAQNLIGLNLGQQGWGAGWWLELFVIIACSAYYLYQAAKNDSFGRNAWWVCGIIVSLHIIRAIIGL
jgi:hypothetical protein